MKTILIGNLTIDQNIIEKKTYISPGGAVYFIAKTFENLGVDTTILSPYGDDFPKESLSKAKFIQDKALPQRNLLFTNIYKSGKREQWVKNYREYLQYSVPMSSREVPTELGRHGDLSDILDLSAQAGIASSPTRNDKIVVIAPVINNISYQLIKKVKKLFPQSFLCLLPQGFFRRIGEHGEVVTISNAFPDEIIRMFNFISLSELDMKEADIKAKK